ncbi:HAMP domain-containing sensor histidine kinase [Abyssisolibacter fermentans]|uniref:HAMP domain-containing sensor histidine kinase n=1 Tax=Abyssisolibacter fermentans TaxID=1766203 RepID=UPI00082FCEFF|nr:HAMP domain-containing sensor histidine kinase [Abyssisolibacter fermentans]
MNKNNKKLTLTAFAYCLKILVNSILGTTLLLGGSIFVITSFSCTTGAVQANIGILFILIVNVELLCPYLLVRQLVKPLEKLNRASAKLAKGEFNVNLDYSGKISEMQQVFLNFKTMTEDLSSIETLRSDFVSNVSHEFKTPLTAIEGYATLLQNPDMSPEEIVENTNRILYNTKRLSSLIGNILMLNKLDNQTLQPEITTYRLDEQILQILLQQENVWNVKALDFELNLKEITFSGPEMLLYHVWSNLISNAVKYSLHSGTIEISLTSVENKIIFSIHDNGIGIASSDMQHIFEKFYQADTSHKSDGNGLGLAQVKKILDITGNQISVKSELGKGCTFNVFLNTFEI